MIIYVIIILLVLTILAWTLLSRPILKVIIGGVLALCLTGATTFLTMTMHNHYGMHQTTTTKTKKIYSAAGNQSPAGILIASKVGADDSKHFVLVYQDTQNKQATAHFLPQEKNITESVKKESYYRTTNSKQATLVSNTTRWEWKSETAKRWLDVGQNQELIKQTNVVMVPKKTWLVLNPQQMEKLQSHLQQINDPQISSEISALPEDDQAELIVKMAKSLLT